MTDMAPSFDANFRDRLETLIAWRRDVRRFSERPVPAILVDHLLDIAQLAPSVGNSQPWRWVRVESREKRAEIRANFVASNDKARAAQPDQRADDYAALKLAGIDRAPVQFAVFCDRETDQGHGLGRLTMPEMLEYSVVGMITNIWLVARAAGLGLGWVSILDPDQVAASMDVPQAWHFVAYLCIGWPEEEHIDPELERLGWQARSEAGRQVKIV
jgi:5,6-dimethylbenzimidazole synthase